MLSVIIVSYNSKTYLNLCIDSVIKSISNSIKYEIIILNNQINETLHINNKKNLYIYNNQINYGYSKSINFGVSKSRGDTILVLNPDVIIKDDAIHILYKYINNIKKAGVVGPKALS